MAIKLDISKSEEVKYEGFFKMIKRQMEQVAPIEETIDVPCEVVQPKGLPPSPPRPPEP